MADIKTASLTVLGGPLAGTQCALPENGTVTIGSAPDSSLYLDLLAVSPYHARVVVEAGRITVHDTGSTRTVHVNDTAIGPEGTELRNGDIVWLGAPGDDEVVMLQAIVPKRRAAPAPAAVPPPAPMPTPDIETVALWAKTRASEREGAPEAAEEPAHGLPSLSEPAPAFDEGGVPDAGVVVGEPAETPVAAEEPEIVAAVLPEAATFIDEAQVEAAPDSDAYVIEDGEAAQVAATILTSSPGEVAEPADRAYPETVALEAPAEFTPEMFEPPAPAAQPVSEATPIEEQAVVVEPPAPEVPPAPAPPPPPAPTPPPPAARPAPAAPAPHAAEARPPLSRKADWQATRPHPPSASQRLSPSASQRRVRPAAARAVEPPPAAAVGEETAAEAASSRRPMLLALGGFVGVLAIAGGAFLAWRTLGSRPSASAPRPTPVAVATAPVATPPPLAATPEPQLPVPTQEPVAAAPTPRAAEPAATPTPRAAEPAATPTPKPTPTPRAAATATPPPAPAGPSPEQQAAAQVQALLGQAEAAAAAKQYDAAIADLDGVLRIEPGNAHATSLRASLAQRRDLAKRRFVAGRTVVDSEKTRRDKAKGGLVGFDTDEKAPDFLGRIEFEMTPASGIAANDAWTLRVFVVNSGGKPIKVQGLTLGATVNGVASSLPVSPGVREIAPQQRAQLAEAQGAWTDGTTSWVAQATLTAPKNETLTNTLTWK